MHGLLAVREGKGCHSERGSQGVILRGGLSGSVVAGGHEGLCSDLCFLERNV